MCLDLHGRSFPGKLVELELYRFEQDEAVGGGRRRNEHGKGDEHGMDEKVLGLELGLKRWRW